MAEYAGYVKRPTPINWGEVAGGIVKRMGDIEQEQAAFREKYDTMAAETSQKIGEYEAGKSKAFNNLVYDATAEGRSMLHEMHNKLKRGEISPDEFNRMTMSISNQWADFSNLAKNYNTAVAGVIDGLDSGELSNASQWALEQFGDMANLKDKRLQWMPSQDGYTNLYVTSVDDEGNMVGDPTSVTSLTNPGNLMFKKVDLPGATAQFTSTVAAFQRGRTTDPRLNPEYKNAKEKALNAVTATKDDVLSILVDYGDKDGNRYTLYKEGEEVPENGIKMVMDENQNWVPEIDKALTDKAKETVDSMFEAQMGSKITPRPKDPSKDDDLKELKELQAFQYDLRIAQEALMGDEKAIENLKNAYNRTSSVDDKIRNIAVVGDQTIIQFESGEDRTLSNKESDRIESAEGMMIYLRPKLQAGQIESLLDKIKDKELVTGDVIEREKKPKRLTNKELQDGAIYVQSQDVTEMQKLMDSFGPGAKVTSILGLFIIEVDGKKKIIPRDAENDEIETNLRDLKIILSTEKPEEEIETKEIEQKYMG